MMTRSERFNKYGIEYRNLWGEMGLVMGKGDEGEEGKEDEEDEGEGLLFMDDDPMDVD